MTKLCGSPTGKEGEVFCIPPGSLCPITEIQFDKQGKLVKSIDLSLGQPLVNVQLSQGGQPCIYYDYDHNALASKKKLPIMNDEYTKTCPEYEFGGKKFAYRDTNTLVPSYPGVSEAYLYKSNDYGKI